MLKPHQGTKRDKTAQATEAVRFLSFLQQLKLQNGEKKRGGQVASLSCLFEPPMEEMSGFGVATWN